MSLTRRKPMSRGSKPMSRGAGFSRKSAPKDPRHAKEAAVKDPESEREQRLQGRAARALAIAVANAGAGVRPGVAPVFTELVVSLDKSAHLSSEPYRRIGAALECVSCGVERRSQFAHANEGKGIGLKTDDRTGFPLCGPALGDEGCHAKFDQYRLVPGGREAHRALARKWGAQTRRRILEAGLWPQRLPKWKDDV